jgi:uncharacterized protein YndB with AHSA1/START domain
MMQRDGRWGWAGTGVVWGCLSALLACAMAWGAESDPPGAGWELVKTRDGVELFERPAPENESLREAFARTTVDQPPDRVMQALRDYPTFPEWSPYTSETRLVRRESATVDVVFQRMDLPWPVGDRYFTIRLELQAPAEDGTLELRWDLAPPDQRVACEDCGVEMPTNHGVWTLKPLDGGRRTLVSCQALSEPGGHVPRFAFRMANERMFPKLVGALHVRAALPKYSAAPTTGARP